MNLKLLVLLTILQLTISIDIPDIPSNFVKDLMRKYSKKYVAWYLHKDQKTVQIKRNITDFGRLYPSIIVEKQLYDSREQDLNLYLLIKQNINAFLDIFSKRQVHHQSIWTVDVTDLSEPLNDVIKKLNGIEAGFSDEMILFRVNNKFSVQFWEVYKTYPKAPLKIANEGYWSEEFGISLENGNHRNQRLKDLQGLQLKVASKVSKPYISELTPDGETNLKMSGLFAEVFFNLQVSPSLLLRIFYENSFIAVPHELYL